MPTLPLTTEEIILGLQDYSVFQIALDGTIRTWNAGSARIYGFSEEEVVGKPFAVLFTQRDREQKAAEEELAQALTHGSTVDERWHQRGDGSARYLTGITTLVRQGETPVGFIKISRDFTPDKQRERRIEAQTAAMLVLTEERTIAEAAPRFLAALGEQLFWDAGALWLVDSSDCLRHIGSWNGPGGDLGVFDVEAPLRGFRRGEGILGEVFASGAPIWIADVAAAPQFTRRELFAGLGLRSAVFFPIVQGHETIGACELFSREVRERDQEFIVLAGGLGVILGSFVERETIERQLEDRNRAREYMLARVSHDLRAPLTTIRGWAQLLNIAAIDATSAGRMIEDAAGVLQMLVDDLIDFARISTGKLRFDREAIELAPFIDSLVEAAVPVATQGGIALSVELIDDDCVVLGDRQRLRQVLDNLLSNALKFTPRGGRVTVRLASEEGHCRIEVEDTGRGISPQLLPHIFDRYKQADAAATQSGLGLGLTIVAELVRLHGGTISAESDGEGRGARFVVRMPGVAR
ncbi:MAG TPA: ATP-binding protein [Thermoanaerobaculia bacterium]